MSSKPGAGQFSELASDVQEYDFSLPVLVSHVEQYATQPERLRKYAKQVIGARILILVASSRMNTQVLLQSYILGVEARNPFSSRGSRHGKGAPAGQAGRGGEERGRGFTHPRTLVARARRAPASGSVLVNFGFSEAKAVAKVTI